MADRSLRDGAIDGRAHGSSLAALCNSRGGADQNQERHRDDRAWADLSSQPCLKSDCPQKQDILAAARR